jgi:hypothetical protein
LAYVEGEILFKSLGKVDELQLIFESAVAIAMMRKGNGGIGRRTMRSNGSLIVVQWTGVLIGVIGDLLGREEGRRRQGE